MGTPLIAVPAYRLPAGRVSHWDQGGFAVPEAYALAAHRAGMRAVAVMESDPDAAVELLDRVDGLLLLGGGDVDPAAYGAERHDRVYGVDADRDAVEIAMVREAIARGKPTLAICRGLQVLNIAFGGTLIQHLPDVPGTGRHGVPGGGGTVLHDVKVSPNTALADATRAELLACASHHHQAVDRVGEGLQVTARSDDGVVEGLEHDGPAWTVAVQWHPEDTAAHDPAQQALFDTLAERARDFASP